MAWRYRERDFESGDILDPRDWNLNWEGLAEEMNGNMDRDNVGAGEIGTAQLGNTALDYAEATLGTSAATVDDPESPGWRLIDDMEKDLSVDSDEGVACELCVQVSADNVPSGSDPDAHLYHVRLTLGGFVVAESGPISMVHTEYCVYICGTGLAVSGSNTLRGEIRFEYNDDVAGNTAGWASISFGNRFISGWRRRR